MSRQSILTGLDKESELKKHNHRMNHGVNKNGYKYTELGWIPEGWEIKKLREILIEGRLGGNYENSESNTGIPVIKMGNLERGKINIHRLQYLPSDEDHNEKDVLHEGDLLFNTRNTLDLVGKVAIWRNELAYAVYNSNLMRMKFNEKYVASNWFMNHVFNSHYGVRQLRGFATGTTSVAAIYGRDLDQFKILLPALPEQRHISDILDTWDNAINKVQQLISLFQQRNHGLTHQLLTGKSRPKGLIRKWESVLLSDCLEYNPREVPKPSTCFFAIGLRSHGKGIFHKNDFEPEDLAMDVLYEVKENDLVVNITFAWEQAIAIAGKEDEGGLVSHRFPTYTFKIGKAIPDFFRFLIIQKDFKYKLDLISPGGAGRNRVMNKRDFLKIGVNIPDVEEQRAIADILNCATSELTFYEKLLAGLQLQKRGLMERLLNGELRLKA